MREYKNPKLKFTTVRQTVFFRADPAEVYDALVDPDKREEWTGQSATGEAKVGSKFTTTDGYVYGKNLKLTKAKLIVQEWKTKEWPDGTPFSLVKYSLKPKIGGTQLTLNHSKIPSILRKYISNGWVEFNWRPLRRYFATIRKRKRAKLMPWGRISHSQAKVRD